jgi:hypothetical protein
MEDLLLPNADPVNQFNMKYPETWTKKERVNLDLCLLR